MRALSAPRGDDDIPAHLGVHGRGLRGPGADRAGEQETADPVLVTRRLAVPRVIFWNPGSEQLAAFAIHPACRARLGPGRGATARSVGARRGLVEGGRRFVAGLIG